MNSNFKSKPDSHCNHSQNDDDETGQVQIMIEDFFDLNTNSTAGHSGQVQINSTFK